MCPTLLYFPYIENLTVSTQGAMALDSLFRGDDIGSGAQVVAGPSGCL